MTDKYDENRSGSGQGDVPGGDRSGAGQGDVYGGDRREPGPGDQGGAYGGGQREPVQGDVYGGDRREPVQGEVYGGDRRESGRGGAYGGGHAGGRYGHDHDVPDPLRMLGQAAWQALMVLGLAAIAVGVITLVWPGRTLLVLGVLFGIYLIISGVMQLIAAFGDHVSGGMRVLNIIVGAVSILLGLFAFRNSLHNSVLLLSLWIGIGFLLWGVATLVTSVSAPPGVAGKGWGVFVGLVTMLGGIIVISWPISSIFALAVFIGIWLVAVGVAEVIHAFSLRSKVEHAGREQRGRHATV